VVFFAGHILHRSLRNRSRTRSRRSFVGHYCNARSLVPWNHGQPYEGDSANYQHILARGTTHLAYGQPRFGTTCAANQPAERANAEPGRPMSMMGGGDGLMGPAPHGDADHD
jgi:phytanoyl-CoA hydroxylase